MIETKTPENAEITRVYGDLLQASQARMGELSIEDFQPAPNTIVIKRADPETLTAGGIHLPDVALKTPSIGTVVAAHKDCFYKVGDIVVTRSVVSGTPFSIKEGDQYEICQIYGSLDDEVVGRFPANGT